jgi:hypothetical protein
VRRRRSVDNPRNARYERAAMALKRALKHLRNPGLAVIAVFFFSVAAFYVAMVYKSLTDPAAWKEISLIMLKGDNIPIAFMLFILCFYTGWGVKEALRNDRLIEQGKRDEILKDMQR